MGQIYGDPRFNIFFRGANSWPPRLVDGNEQHDLNRSRVKVQQQPLDWLTINLFTINETKKINLRKAET